MNLCPYFDLQRRLYYGFPPTLMAVERFVGYRCSIGIGISSSGYYIVGISLLHWCISNALLIMDLSIFDLKGSWSVDEIGQEEQDDGRKDKADEDADNDVRRMMSIIRNAAQADVKGPAKAAKL